MAREVMSTGRSRTRHANATASRTIEPRSRSVRVNSTIRILLETAIPVSITTPMSDITFNVVPVNHNVTSTPVRPGGTARRIKSGSMKLRN